MLTRLGSRLVSSPFTRTLALSVLAATALAATAARASSDDDVYDLTVALKGGSAKLKGDFAKEDRVSAGGVWVGFQPGPSLSEHFRDSNWLKRALYGFEFRSFISLDSATVEQKGDWELVPAGEKAEISTLFVASQLCALADAPVQICPYLGLGNATVQDHAKHGDRYRTEFFTMPYGLVVPYVYRLDGWGVSAGLTVDAYRVDQTTDSKTRHFSAVMTGIFAGVLF